MPSLVLTTNVKVADPRAFSLEFSKLSAQILRKPEQYISISLQYNEHLTFKGNFDPAFLLVVTSLGNISPEQNEEYSKLFFDYFARELGIPGDRGYITFYDPGNAYLGHQGTTFATIFGK
ncbi:hypothetical protein EVG20_g2329 [Dentipellis fragilis]|uniref:L-dopachrome isomerase n=1 Tax=Dentipellis fragilis TaxID=205917 RepID=A0A4Y9Z7F8_9AGAM|nr:hypothetical protein EVG20_g2329 [Dentipellis fragilis]